ncbi:hypothetical protein N9561_00780, partial [bacterium]|nr:hypothetical protein [bacterium]
MEAGFDGTVKNIVANTNAHTTEEFGCRFKIEDEILSVLFAEGSLKGRHGGLVEVAGTFDSDLFFRDLGSNEATESLKHTTVTAGLLGRKLRNGHAKVLLVHLSV